MTTVPEFVFVDDCVRFWSERRPDAEALVSAGTRVTWRELRHRVDAFARALLAHGVGPGDRVAMLCAPGPEFLEVFLATASIGAVWLGLDPRHRLAELRRVLADAEPCVLIAVPGVADERGAERADELRNLMAGQPSVRILVTARGLAEEVPARIAYDVFGAAGADAADSADSVAALAAARSARDPLGPTLLVYTSGSTGRPKGALLTHRGLTRCSAIQARHWDIAPGERVLCNLPVDHVGCVGDLGMATLVQGGSLCFAERFDPEETLALIERERIAMWGQIPAMFQLCLAAPGFGTRDLSSLRHVVWSGAACPADTARVLAGLGAAVSTGYGLTETTGSVTYSDPGADPVDLVETVGRPDPAYDVRVARVTVPGAADEDHVCAVGERGEVQVRGDFVMAGYWRAPEATAAAFTADGWLRTGDSGTLRADGNLVVHGRLAELYRSGGYHVAPREVESVLDEHPGVAAAVVVAVPDPLWGHVGHAYVVPRSAGSGDGVNRRPAGTGDEAARVDPGVLRAHVRARLANYKVPKVFELCTRLPLLPTGKIDRAALRARAAATLGTTTDGG